MSRKFEANLDGLVMSGAGNVVEIFMPEFKFGRITRFVLKINNNTLPTAQMLQFQGKLYTGSSLGTGGTSSGVIQKMDQGDADPAATAAYGTTSSPAGSLVGIVYSDACYLYQGIDTPAPGDGITLLSEQLFALQLVQSPAGGVNINFSGRIEWEEMG